MSDNKVVNATSNSAENKLNKFFEDKDWKFYAAILAGVGVIGASAYYLSQPSTPKAPKASKKEGKSKKPSSNETTREETKSTTTTTTTTTTATSKSIDYATLSDEAIKELTAEQKDEAAQGLKDKGNKLYNGKKYEDAIAAYSNALRYKSDPIYYSNRAACHSFLGNYDLVIADTNDALKLDNAYVKAINRRAQALEKVNKLEDALYDFTCVCILDGFKNENATKSMERLLKQVASTRAKEILESKKDKLTLPSSTYVKAYLDSFRPTNIELPTTTDESSGDYYLAKAFHAIAELDYKSAAEYSEKAVELGCSPTYLPYALNLKGTFVFLKGDAASALECLNKSIELNPDYVQNYIKRSSIYIEQQDLDSAFREFENAIDKNPSDPDTYYHRGQIHYISTSFDAAVKDYNESIKLDDSFVYAYVQLGVAQYKMGSISSAMSTFNNTLKKFPNSAEVQNYYGELLADQKRFPEAVEAFTKSIELDPKNPLPYINKAMLTFQEKKDVDEAIRLCKQALEADPACDAAVASLGEILLQQGNAQEALQYYEMAIDLARTEPELEHTISYVEATKTQIRFAKDFPEVAAKLKNLQ